MKERGGTHTHTKEVASDLFPAFNAATNKKGELVPERKKNASYCSLIQKQYFFFSMNQLGTKQKLFFFSDK